MTLWLIGDELLVFARFAAGGETVGVAESGCNAMAEYSRCISLQATYGSRSAVVPGSKCARGVVIAWRRGVVV